MIDLAAVGVRSYIAEPDRARRDWSEEPEAQTPVYGNRYRIRGRRGRRLMRRRGETIERSFAHLYDTGGMPRTHLRGHTNILKRLLIHAGGFNLGLVMRSLTGCGTPRGRQGRVAAVIAALLTLITAARPWFVGISRSSRLFAATREPLTTTIMLSVHSSTTATCATG
jgi:transposase